MSVFAYTALNKEGRMTSGTLSSDSRAAAMAEMARKGLSPVTIDEAADATSAARKAQAAALAAAGPSSGKVSSRAVESFTRELANLLAGGVPLARALALLRREASNPAAGQLWNTIHDDVVGGMPLAEAMAKWPRTFPSVYVAMVRAGEAGGFLDVVLSQIADFRAREQDLKGKFKGAMIYPVILGCVAIGIMILMLEFFIPRFSTIFASMGTTLPVLTLVVVGISKVVQHYGLIVLLVLIVAGVLLSRALNTESGRRRMEIIMLSTPVLGSVIAHFALVRFARMLGTLVGAGVPLIASLRVAREAIGNQTLADTVGTAIEEVQSGSPLSKSLAGCPSLFPASVVEMVAVAEETGRLDKELIRLATSYEIDLDRQLRLLVAVAEPVMLFVMAGVIGTIVISMLLPIFSLWDQMQ
jgi:type II secretory pathway component PulF